MRFRCVFMACLIVLLVSMNQSASYAQDTTLQLPSGYRAEVIAKNLNLPTHLADGPDGALYITQLTGDENNGQGQVVRIEKPGADPQVMIEGLLKPTGLAWAGDNLYLVARDTILVSHYANGKFDKPQAVFSDTLPFNGRSNGQIFLGPDGFLYFQSTGTEAAPKESGFIYRMKPGTNERKIYARGFKNTYAMAWNVQTNPQVTTMYATEIGDGAVPGVGQLPEELNVIKVGGDYGWPACYADQRENAAFGGNRNICADTDVPLALFAPDATPTGLAYFDDQLIVALWNGNPPRLVSVDPHNGKVTDWASGFRAAIALLVDKDGGLLVLDFYGNTITRITKKA